jgi:hypothetical protein
MRRLIVALLPHHKVHSLVNREATRLLPRGELLESLQVLAHDELGGNEYKGVLNEPFVIPACLVLRSLEGIGTQVDLAKLEKVESLRDELAKACKARATFEHSIALSAEDRFTLLQMRALEMHIADRIVDMLLAED